MSSSCLLKDNSSEWEGSAGRNCPLSLLFLVFLPEKSVSLLVYFQLPSCLPPLPSLLRTKLPSCRRVALVIALSSIRVKKPKPSTALAQPFAFSSTISWRRRRRRRAKRKNLGMRRLHGLRNLPCCYYDLQRKGSSSVPFCGGSIVTVENGDADHHAS